MLRTKRPWPVTGPSLLLPLALLAGCATPTPKPVDVGVVVVAPRAKLSPVPKVVQETAPMEPGFFQKSLLNFFSPKPKKPTE